MRRIFDILISAILLVLLSPAVLLVSILILCTMGRPIFFRQERPGKNGKIFRLVKFRTMADDPTGSEEVLVDQSRVTPLGRILRKISLDEIPQLWNVLKGEMSLVGPRPLLVEYLPHYSPEQMRRHDVRPGITGWAQVNGRNSISWDEKFSLDVWYVDNQSFLLDLKILLLTVKSVLAKSGVNASSEITMPKFTGSESAQGTEKQ